MTTTEKSKKQTMTGKVVSDKMDKTVLVLVRRYVKTPIYKKFERIEKRYKAHDPENRSKVGDTVTIEACRPISKDKHFAVVYK
jgi:small subunit ribosomal protein S17